ncbi:hypothetical protein [Mycetocola saprophilus]|uniref:hypothetical protein n=1 Tax=Mycetocola saprophilus TaxID=76636 RepID=UPI0004BED70F|nr:hypothetical protein [Mycetocola saprophilus]
MSTTTRTVAERNLRRARVRLWTTVGAIPFVLAGLLLVIKILSIYAFAHLALLNVHAERYSESAAAARGLAPVNIFEPFKAPFDLSVGLAEDGLLKESREQLEAALPRTPGLAICTVRINLAMVIERQGDRATQDKDVAGGQKFYQEALKTIVETSPNCRTPEADRASSDPSRSMDSSLTTTEESIRGKILPPPPPEQGDGSDSPPPPPEETPPPPPGPSDDQLEKLKKQLEQGDQERGNGGTDQGGNPDTERPW